MLTSAVPRSIKSRQVSITYSSISDSSSRCNTQSLLVRLWFWRKNSSALDLYLAFLGLNESGTSSIWMYEGRASLNLRPFPPSTRTWNCNKGCSRRLQWLVDVRTVCNILGLKPHIAINGRSLYLEICSLSHKADSQYLERPPYCFLFVIWSYWQTYSPNIGVRWELADYKNSIWQEVGSRRPMPSILMSDNRIIPCGLNNLEQNYLKISSDI